MRHAMVNIALALTGVWLAGCAASPEAQRGSIVPVVLAEARYQPVYDAAIDVLRDRGFRVDRQDFRFGRITTQPRPSPTVFEPWVRDNSNAAQTLASTADHLQRRVTVMLDPLENVEGEFGLSVEVVIERREFPLRRLTGTAERRQLDALSAVPAEWEARGITETYAQPIGRDAEMERGLVVEILARAEAK